MSEKTLAHEGLMGLWGITENIGFAKVVQQSSYNDAFLGHLVWRNAFANLFISQIHSFVVGFQGMAEQPTNKTVMLQGTWGLEVTHAGDMCDEVFYLVSTSGTEQ